ncbi:MAG: thioredoxin-like domain-containing protein [Planctomycetota bacterium]
MHRSFRWLAALLIALIASSPLLVSTPLKAQFMAPELEPNLGWLNTDRPLSFEDDLKGHIVVLDFWTYCCINCIHVLPDLEYLEEKYADEPFVVVGVHSAKFTNEADRESIRHAMHRYGIRHPVVIDDGMRIWQTYGARSWPTVVVIGADGEVIGAAPGEGNRDILDRAVRQALDDARDSGVLAERKTDIVLDAEVSPASGLTFPGKVHAAADDDRLFVADSSGHRVIVSTFPDADGVSEVVAVLGSGEPGFADGVRAEAAFQDPQGLAFDPTLGEAGTLYVADAKNHAVRAVDLKTLAVATIAGNGERSYDRAGGEAGRDQGLASPWALQLGPDRSTLYVANAGTHQIWSIDLKSGRVANLAGSGRENSLDGSLEGSALAQPSGLALSADGERLYFADSESSSIRVVDLSADEVRTVVGFNVASGSQNGLFEFGDIDGVYPDARLQHALGVTLLESDDETDLLLVADTYNHKIKLVNTAERSSSTWVGDGRGLTAGGATPFDEPGGLHYAAAAADRRPAVFVADTNNHRVVRIDPITLERTDIVFRGLRGDAAASVEGAIGVTTAIDPASPARLVLAPDLPAGAKVNAEFPVTVRVSARDDASNTLDQRTLRADAAPFEIEVDGAAVDAGVVVELSFAYCTEGDDSVCRPANIAWSITNEPGDGSAARLTARIAP